MTICQLHKKTFYLSKIFLDLLFGIFYCIYLICRKIFLEWLNDIIHHKLNISINQTSKFGKILLCNFCFLVKKMIRFYGKTFIQMIFVIQFEFNKWQKDGNILQIECTLSDWIYILKCQSSDKLSNIKTWTVWKWLTIHFHFFHKQP